MTGSRPFSEVERRLQADAREALAAAWSQPDYYAAVSEAIRRLVPASEPGIVRWRGPRQAPERLDRADDDRFHLPYARTGEWTRSLPYDPSKRDPLAGRVVDTDQLERGHRETVGRFREAFLRPAGLRSILRVTVYDGPRLLAVCGFMRPAGEVAFTPRERAIFQSLVPDLIEGMTARHAVEHDPLDPGSVGDIVKAMGAPAMVVSEAGTLLVLNEAARAAFPSRPEWILSAARGEGCAPPWVRRVPLVAGRQRLVLLMVDLTAINPDGADRAPWARAWDLSPRYARVAAYAMQGLADKEIALRTGLTVNSVRTYVRVVLARAGASNRAALARLATRSGVRKG